MGLFALSLRKASFPPWHMSLFFYISLEMRSYIYSRIYQQGVPCVLLLFSPDRMFEKLGSLLTTTELICF